MVEGTYNCDNCGTEFDWCGVVKQNIKYGVGRGGICEGDLNAEIERISINKIKVKAKCPNCNNECIFEEESK